MQLHLIDLAKTSNEIWEKISILFGGKENNENFSLKLQLFRLKMHDEIGLSTHINELMSLFRKLVETGAKVEPYDAKAILLNSLSSKYSKVAFTLSLLSSQSLEEMVASLSAEEKRAYSEDSNVEGRHEIALYSKGKMRKPKG